ncbi:hypothetical protein GIB67_037408 [Kingdonia uniflora]|uniref:Uncharacterized protein n=1 Tax=Kingdonia uniflora TaxID=39325 RepID=A0A7J7M8U1_9MAGN|nr:hypothetical protein GIB67_037408 [Kingdonia uniflora]
MEVQCITFRTYISINIPLTFCLSKRTKLLSFKPTKTPLSSLLSSLFQSKHTRLNSMFLVGNIAENRRRQQAVIVWKEIREALVRTKWLCREGIVSDGDVLLDKEMVIDDDEDEVLNAQTIEVVGELKSILQSQGKGVAQKKVESLRNLRRPPVEAAIKASIVKGRGKAAFHLDHQMNRMFSWQLLEAAWCLTNIAAGEPEQTKALIPALPMLIAHIGAVSNFKQHFAYIWRYLPSPVKSKVASQVLC